MRTLLCYLLLTMLVSSCQKDSPINNEVTIEEGGGLPETDISSYDENLIPPKMEPLDNRLANGDFETQVGWVFCGDATIVNDTEAPSGDRFLQLASNDECPENIYSTRKATAYFPVDFTSVPDQVVISFWVRTSRQIELGFDTDFSIGLFSEERINTQFGDPMPIFNLYERQLDDQWSKIRLVADREHIERYGFGEVPAYLWFSLSTVEDITISIDNIKITTEIEVTQPDPMPNALKNYMGNDWILFKNVDKNVPALMKPNGTNVINIANVDADLVTDTPAWYGDSNFTLSAKLFNPEVNTDATLIPASQSELYKYDLNGQRQDLLYETLGNPGRLNPADPANNFDALDVEILHAAWNLDASLGALTVVGINRRVPAAVFKIYIVDGEGNPIGEPFLGQNGAWSKTNELVYTVNDEESVYKASVNGNSVATSKIYQSKSDIAHSADWSPDGQSVVLAESAKALNRSGQYATSIHTLNLSTGAKKELTLVDQGNFAGNLSWANNGEFIIYSLFIPTAADPSIGYNQIWWIELATGKTGPLTNNISGYGATFRK